MTRILFRHVIASESKRSFSERAPYSDTRAGSLLRQRAARNNTEVRYYGIPYRQIF
jgi:hypothetical protein